MSTHFDAAYWRQHWAQGGPQPLALPPHPYLHAETADLERTTVLDAGCGIGTEALWLASEGWRVTAVDISATALTTALARSAAAGLPDTIDWIEADLSRWEPEQTWDLVVTHYAHTELGPLALYERLASWVAPGGVILIVGHADKSTATEYDHDRALEHPKNATVTLRDVTNLLISAGWRIESGYENARTVQTGDAPVHLHDVVVRARSPR